VNAELRKCCNGSSSRRSSRRVVNSGRQGELSCSHFIAVVVGLLSNKLYNNFTLARPQQIVIVGFEYRRDKLDRCRSHTCDGRRLVYHTDHPRLSAEPCRRAGSSATDDTCQNSYFFHRVLSSTLSFDSEI